MGTFPTATSEGVRVVPHSSFADAPQLDVLFVPGGGGIVGALGSESYRRFLQARAKEAAWITSVCHGSLLLAAAGLLDGYEAITHWGWLDCLRMFPRVKVPTSFHARYHRDRNRITGGGISSALDQALGMATILVDEKAAKKSQLVNQYQPAPPFHDGLPDAAAPEILREVLDGGMGSFVEATREAIRKLLEGPISTVQIP